MVNEIFMIQHFCLILILTLRSRYFYDEEKETLRYEVAFLGCSASYCQSHNPNLDFIVLFSLYFIAFSYFSMLSTICYQSDFSIIAYP